ncbi:hypothetical protein BGZ63DRAFT_426043 [Mariannaea sp. PMI_226]|nr:hypothetical protein BGZ63DRAFT_426043 [Mariannaea sp. PMI_226]
MPSAITTEPRTSKDSNPNSADDNESIVPHCGSPVPTTTDEHQSNTTYENNQGEGGCNANEDFLGMGAQFQNKA